MSGARGRFAPSPTGPLHFGSLVAALASYCDARASGREWLVRIEDVDEPRSRTDAERAILAALTRYGLRWDGEIVRQSERTAIYESALDRLRGSGLVYACACTRRDMDRAPMNASGERIYQGTCRDGIPPPRAAAGHAAIRLRVGDAVVSYVDAVQGPQRQDLAREVGDFIVRRADGLFAYQLAVVVDDALQGVDSIVRGADLLPSTPRQIHLQRCLDVATPEYLHVPVAINASGEKLSKQTGAAALPDDPLPALLLAWRFLDQAMPPHAPQSAQAFMSYAIGAWSRTRLPPTVMLPAPRV
ncbi:MAG TPA: tRNA glutamyl-Q(34) synthetase GluQRS [Casimicrobiaceae bacterium]|nr:tRNA glutamyl-Q(34) synthetase GluQRS [Casimicrobiaceae bacterium]